MAISATHYRLLRELRERDVLPQRGRILEIGKANWYGDMSYAEVLRELGELPAEGPLPTSLDRPFDGDWQGYSFAVVKRLYDKLFDPSAVVSIDLDPAADGALRFDLNDVHFVFNDPERFNLSINHGTAEHIFNIANVFKVMHDATIAGGLMIHESPFTGWVDHGFYCLQPTLFYDLAAANNYEIVGVWLEHLKSQTTIAVQSREHIGHLRRSDQLPDDAMLFVVLRKGADEPFKIPMQGVYAGTVSEEVQAAWRDLR